MSAGLIERQRPPFALPAVRVEMAQDREAWDGFVATHPDCGHEHAWVWGEIIAGCFRHRPRRLIARRGEQVVGVLPLVDVRGLIVGRALMATPYLNGGGLVADDEEAEAALLGRAAAMADDAGSHVELRQRRTLRHNSPGWCDRSHKVAMTLELGPDPERTMARLPGKLRSQIRRPVKAGGLARTTSGAAAERHEIDGLYSVFATNMRDLGTPVYPRRLFIDALAGFGPLARLVTVWLGGTCVAGGITVGAGRRTEMLWGSSLRRHNALSVNMLLYAEAIRQACVDGFTTFDFGRSSLGSGPFRFKQQWGASPIPLHWYYHMPDGRNLPDLDPGSPRYRMMVAAWRRLPLPLTRGLGPWLTRSLP